MIEEKYEIPEPVCHKTCENSVVYGLSSHPVHLDVTIEDNSMVSAVRKALEMIKGVTSVRMMSIITEKSTTDPFAELDTNWGGHRDANEIAEELKS